MKMKPRERVVAALNCRTPDRVPVVEYLFSPKLQQEILGYTTPLYDGPCQLALAHKLGLNGMWIPINGFCGLEEEVHSPGASYQDEWGVTYVKNGWPIMVQTEYDKSFPEKGTHSKRLLARGCGMVGGGGGLARQGGCRAGQGRENTELHAC